MQPTLWPSDPCPTLGDVGHRWVAAGAVENKNPQMRQLDILGIEAQKITNTLQEARDSARMTAVYEPAASSHMGLSGHARGDWKARIECQIWYIRYHRYCTSCLVLYVSSLSYHSPQRMRTDQPHGSSESGTKLFVIASSSSQ